MSAPSFIAPTAPEALDQVLSIPDDVFAPNYGDQPDPFSWRDDDEPAAGPVLVMPKKTLRAHVSDVEAIADTIESLDDSEMTDEARDDLSKQLIGAIAGTKRKVDNCGAALAMFESLEASAAKECERLTRRVAYYARQRERLETYILAVLDASNLPRIDGDTSTLSRRMNPPSVQITEPAAVPADFMRRPPAPAPVADKSLIKSAILAGIDVPGCALTRTARLVRS